VPVGFDQHDSPVNPLHDGLRGVGLVNAGKKLAARYDALTIMERIGKYAHGRVAAQLSRSERENPGSNPGAPATSGCECHVNSAARVLASRSRADAHEGDAARPRSPRLRLLRAALPLRSARHGAHRAELEGRREFVRYEVLILSNRKILADQMEFLLHGVPKSSRVYASM
jgi:hypothetical protein